MCQHSYSRILKKYINLKYLLTYAESGKKGVDTAIDYEITKIETGRGG
jgi:predicted phage-related endonuclease